MHDLPPAIVVSHIATHLANAGIGSTLSHPARLEAVDQALRDVYAAGWRLERTKVLADAAAERRELLDDLSQVTAQRDRLLDERVGRTVTGTGTPGPRPGSLADRLRRARQDVSRATSAGVRDDEIEDLGRQAREVGHG